LAISHLIFIMAIVKVLEFLGPDQLGPMHGVFARSPSYVVPSHLRKLGDVHMVRKVKAADPFHKCPDSPWKEMDHWRKLLRDYRQIEEVIEVLIDNIRDL